MRRILVPTAARRECANARDVAFRLAAELGADVTACHVRPECHERRSAAPKAGNNYAQVAAARALGKTAFHAAMLANSSARWHATRLPANGRSSGTSWLQRSMT